MNSKKRIVVIGLKGLPAYGGGAAAVGENLIERLKEDFEFTVLSVSSHTSLNTGFYKGVKQIVFKSYGRTGLSILYYIQCIWHCVMNKYDIIHIHHGATGFLTSILKFRSKVLVTLHGACQNDDPKFSAIQNKIFRFLLKINIKYADEIVSVSKPDKEFLIRKYGRQIKYVPNGILERSCRRDGKNVSGKYIFFAAGRIFQTKGLHLLLNAAKKIDLDLEIWIAGDLEQVDEYKNLISELQTGLKINFLGLIKDKDKLEEIISNSLFFVFPSLNEAMSMMLLEVVATGTPVIASDISANTSIFNSEEILFFESGNYIDLADKLDFAISNNGEIQLKAHKAYEKLINNYTWSSIALQYKEIYNELLIK